MFQKEIDFIFNCYTFTINLAQHDSFVAPLTKLLGLTEEISQPPYLPAIALELRHFEQSPGDFRFFVVTYLKNNSIDEPNDMRLMQLNGKIWCLLEHFLGANYFLNMSKFCSEKINCSGKFVLSLFFDITVKCSRIVV